MWAAALGVTAHARLGFLGISVGFFLPRWQIFGSTQLGDVIWGVYSIHHAAARAEIVPLLLVSIAH